jgi:hypothetical protein
MKFSGVLNWQDSEGHVGTVGEFKDIEADDQAAASKIVLSEFWDDRLDSASCVPIFTFSDTEEDEYISLFEECVESGLHLEDCDEDGFCNRCGYQD